ncbi:MAG: hypothetical protein WBA68_13540 [Alteraurantiacibacter sp.]
MRILTVCALLVCAGCEKMSDSEPSLEEISSATLAYANCIDGEATRAERFSLQDDAAVESILAACEEERSAALERRAVPVMAKTQAEFDETHEGLARTLFNNAKNEAERL